MGQHNRVVKNLGTIVRPREKKIIFNILYPLADGDLEQLLCLAPSQTQSLLRDNPLFGQNVRPDDLIYESTNLASAVAFLHHELRPERNSMTGCFSDQSSRTPVGYERKKGTLACAHFDLKPDNILVFHQENRDIHPVGKWKITDFGLSKIKPTKGKKPDNHLGDHQHQWHTWNSAFSEEDCPRPAGPYAAPEIKGREFTILEARSSDIWSLGCILVVILAFALGGEELVRQFQNCKEEKAKRGFFYRELSPGVEAEPLKLEIREWMEGLVHMYPSEASWIPSLNEIIFSMLCDFKSPGRPTAKKVETLLRENVGPKLSKECQKSKITETAPPSLSSPATRELVTKENPSLTHIYDNRVTVSKDAIINGPTRKEENILSGVNIPFVELCVGKTPSELSVKYPSNAKFGDISAEGDRIAFVSEKKIRIYALGWENAPTASLIPKSKPDPRSREDRVAGDIFPPGNSKWSNLTVSSQFLAAYAVTRAGSDSSEVGYFP